MPLPAPVNGRPAEGSRPPTGSADLSTKPVLDWTPDDWARWARPTVIAPAPAGGDAPDREAGPEPDASPEPPEPEPTSGPLRVIWPAPATEVVDAATADQGAEAPSPPVAATGGDPDPRHPDLDPEPDAGAVATWWASRPARTETVTVEGASPPATARPGPWNRPPAHRRRPPARVTGEHRSRAVGGLVLVAALVGAVLASLVTVGLFVITLVLQGLTG